MGNGLSSLIIEEESTPTRRLSALVVEEEPTVKKKEVTPVSQETSTDVSEQPVKPSSESGAKVNADGGDYDYATADIYGIKPDESGHWQSRAELSKSESEKLGLPVGSGIILKGSNHPTYQKTIKGEADAGFKIIKRGDRYYSVPSAFNEWTNASAPETEFTTPTQEATYDPTAAETFRRKETERLKQIAVKKSDEVRADYSQAKQEVNAVDFATQYPEYNQLLEIDKQLGALGEPKTQQGMDAYSALAQQREQLLNTSVAGRDVFKESAPVLDVKKPENFDSVSEYGEYQRGIDKQFKEFTDKKKKFEGALPKYEGATTLRDIIAIGEKSRQQVVALDGKIKANQKEADAAIAAARELNADKLKPLGFGEGFMEGMEQTTLANTVADIYFTGNDDELLKSLENLYEDSVVFPKETTTGGAIGEVIGGQVKPLTVGIAGGALNPYVGVAGASVYYGRMGTGSALMDAYATARSQGATAPEALEIAKQSALVGGAGGVAEGLAGAITFGGKPFASLATMPFKKAVIGALKDNGIDTVVAGINQVVQNKNLQRLGLDVEASRGVAENMGAELVFGAGMNMAMYGGSKIKGYGTIINGLAKLPLADIQIAVDNAVKEGVLNEAKANQFMTNVAASRGAQDRLKAIEIPEDVEDNVIELQKQIDKLESDKKDASPAVLPAIESQIEVKSMAIAEETGAPLSLKEQKEYEKLIEKRDAPVGEGAEKKELLDSEKKTIEHYEKRVENAEKISNEVQVEAKKADIKRRRLEELDKARNNNLDLARSNVGEFIDFDTVNAKYDAELVALSKEAGDVVEMEPTITEEKPVVEAEEPADTNTAQQEPITQQEAVDFLDRHVVQSKIDKYSERPDFKLSSDELARGIKQIRNGQTDKVAAKKVLARIEEWRNKGYVDVIHGADGHTARIDMPYDFTVEDVAVIDKTEQLLDTNSENIKQVLGENFTMPDGNIDADRLRTELEKAEQEAYWGDLLGLNKEELLTLRNILSDEQSIRATKEPSVEGESQKPIGQEEVKSETSIVDQSQDYETLTEAIKMPDGEDGVKLSIKKPNGEVVEAGSFYPEDVEAEAAKKIRGFKLSEAKTETVEATEEAAPAQDFTDKEIAFEHAGSEKTGKVISVDEKGSLKVKGKDGTNYTVKPENARSAEQVEQAKKSIQDNLKKLNTLIKKPKGESDIPPPIEQSIVPKDIVTAPFKLLGMGDKLIAQATSKLEDGVARSSRKGMANSNKYVSRGASEVQGLFKQLALTQQEMVERRKALGQMSAAPLKAVKFYQSGVDVVGKTPESLQNVHMVLDPEVYSARGLTPKAEADLSPAEKNLYDLLRSTNDMIHDWHYVNGRISEETYIKNKGKYAPRFYDNIEFEGLPNELKESFEDYAKQQNFSYVKERKAFEDVMGENTVTEDPVYGTSMRLAQMLRNQAVMEYASALKSKVKTYEEGEANIPNSYVKLEGGGRFGNINTYGELTNRYVPRDIAEDFKGSLFLNTAMNNLYGAFKWYDRLGVRQLIKRGLTTYNPITQLGNIGSNYVFAMMNGIDPLTFQNRKFEAAKEVKERGDLYLKLVEEGILGTDITTKDLKTEAKGEPVTEQGLLGKIDDKVSEFYGSRDDIAKIAAYLSHVKDYGRTESEALKRVSEGFQNYNNVGRFYDFAAKTPLVGNPFIKFKGDLMRIMKNNFSQRPLTNIALLAGLNTLATAFSKWSDEDETLKEIRERRTFIPKVPLPDGLGGDIPLVWKTPIGEINAARYFSPFSIYDMGDKGSVVEEVTQFLPYQIAPEEPFTKFPDPFLGVYTQLAFDKDFRGKPILDPEATKWRAGNATAQEKIQNAATFIARQQIPFFSNADDMLRAYNGETDYYGRNRDLKQALLSNMLKVQEFEKPEAIESLKGEIDYRLGQMDKLNREVSTAKNLAEKNIESIRERKIDTDKEQELIRAEGVRAENKIAELMDRQAEIKLQLIEPKELLNKIGEQYAGESKGKSSRSKTKWKKF